MEQGSGFWGEVKERLGQRGVWRERCSWELGILHLTGSPSSDPPWAVLGKPAADTGWAFRGDREEEAAC